MSKVLCYYGGILYFCLLGQWPQQSKHISVFSFPKVVRPNVLCERDSSSTVVACWTAGQQMEPALGEILISLAQVVQV